MRIILANFYALIFLLFCNFFDQNEAKLSKGQQKIIEEIMKLGEWLEKELEEIQKIINQKSEEKWKEKSQHISFDEGNELKMPGLKELIAKIEKYLGDKELRRMVTKSTDEVRKYFGQLNGGMLEQMSELEVRNKLEGIAEKFNEFRLEEWEKRKVVNIEKENTKNNIGNELAGGIVGSRKGKEPMHSGEGTSNIERIEKETKTISIEEKVVNLANEIVERIFRLNKAIWLQNYWDTVVTVLINNRILAKTEIRREFEEFCERNERREGKKLKAIREIIKQMGTELKRPFEHMMAENNWRYQSTWAGPIRFSGLYDKLIDQFEGILKWNDKTSRPIENLELEEIEEEIRNEKKNAKIEKRELDAWLLPVEGLIIYLKGFLKNIESRIERKIQNKIAKQEYELQYSAILLNNANIELALMLEKELLDLGESTETKNDELEFDGEYRNLISIKILADQIIRTFLSKLSRKIIEEGKSGKGKPSSSRTIPSTSNAQKDNQFVVQMKKIIQYVEGQEEFNLAKLNKKIEEIDGMQKNEENRINGPMMVGVNVILDALKLVTISIRLDKLRKIFGINEGQMGVNGDFVEEEEKRLEKQIKIDFKMPKTMAAYFYENFVTNQLERVQKEENKPMGIEKGKMRLKISFKRGRHGKDAPNQGSGELEEEKEENASPTNASPSRVTDQFLDDAYNTAKEKKAENLEFQKNWTELVKTLKEDKMKSVGYSGPLAPVLSHKETKGEASEGKKTS